jgi:hypothetical protein
MAHPRAGHPRRGRTPQRQEVLHLFERFLHRSGLKERSFHSLRDFL